MMIRQNWQSTKKYKSKLVWLMLMFAMVLWGCGGGGSGGSADGDDEEDSPPTLTWSGTPLVQLEAGGLLTPNVAVSAFDGSTMTVAYFEDAQTSGSYNIKQFDYTIAVRQASEVSVPETIITVDHCGAMAVTVNDQGAAVVAYRGGEVKVCGDEKQADAMFSISDGGSWQEYTGAIGYVERNTYFADGYVNGDMDVVKDSSGNVHLCFQFMYEGCDTMNFNYPDLNYIMKAADDLSADVPEEQVEGSVFYTGGGDQNNVGHHCKMVLDSFERPVIFYYAELSDDTVGLRMARKIAGFWEKTWVETDVAVEAISCAMDHQGNIGVAYYVKDYMDQNTNELSPACLRYAVNTLARPTTWQVRMVDDTSLCGKYPNLAFNNTGNPSIAYYDIETYSGYDRRNLRLATYNGQAWVLETVYSAGDIGLYNNLWFDEDDFPYICTYSQSEKRIYLFHKS